MKTKIKLITLFLVAICFNTMAEIIYVDVSNTSGIEDGSEQYPFNTIREGINAAIPGDTVFIKQGTYIPDETWWIYDSCVILKAGVKLIGEGADITIIDGFIADTLASNLSIGLEKLKFDGFRFTRGTIAGPFPDQNVISQCITLAITITHGAGIPVNDTTHGPIYGFTIDNNDLGGIVFVQGSGVAENRILNNSCGIISIKSGGGYTYVVDNNDIEFGIEDKSGVNTTTISNNRIVNGPIIDDSGGNPYGIEDEIIENNIINCNEDSPLLEDEDFKAGIIAKPKSVTIRNNTITCTGNVSGIRASSGAPFHVIDNIITIDEVLQPSPIPDEGTIGLYNISGWGYVTGNKIYGGDVGYYSKAGTVEFANNEINKAYTGFYSKGAENVHHNTIEECYGDGMILDGLRGPIHCNTIRNNGGSGVLVLHNIDLGGGDDASPGCNLFAGNGNYDLYIAATSSQFPILYARHNVWDHTVPDEIAQYDIRDGSDSTGLMTVDFLPLGNLGIDNMDFASNLHIYPNPFSGKTVAGYKLQVAGYVELAVFDINGKEVATLINQKQPPGTYEVEFNAGELPSGIYYCRLTVGKCSQTKKMVLVR